ncbi:Gyp7p [Sugiyamaella lignohabitans]|uniref:GTPase-activating protein GYP7 n=1 Tax=Sugiyamaella lignohabitans TaxID=796027 RepID=A0A167FQV7_9ASCO|nr:Gyp7p [Sugiyamaella lignohabitans]ANB15583.1 Gyp7p [Sugiyamaella lignohabitans]
MLLDISEVINDSIGEIECVERVVSPRFFDDTTESGFVLVDMDARADSSTKVQLLFSKSKVYVHPTSSAKDNIPGYLALVRPKNASNTEVLLSWVPESSLAGSRDLDYYVKVDLEPPHAADEIGPSTNASNSRNTSGIREVLVSPPPRSSISSYAFSIPLSNIYSIQVRPPSFGWWWGSLILHTKTEETLPALFFHDSESQSTILQRKQRTKDFEPFANGDELFWGGEQFLQSLKNLAALETSTLEPSIMLVNPEPEDRRAFSPRSAKVQQPKEDPISKALKDVRWSILEKLARVTRLSRQVALDVIDKSPQSVKVLLNKPEVKKIGDDFDSAKVYLAKWALGIAEEAQRSRSKVVWNDGYEDIMGSAVGDFELLSVDYSIERRNEVGLAEWSAFFDHTGRLSLTVSEVKERIFHGGLAPAVRSQAWLFLLGVFPWDSDESQRRSILSEKRNEYYRLKGKWWNDTERQDDDFWKDQKSRIEKDVHRTDRNISIFSDSDTPHPDPESRFAETGTNLHLEQLKDLLITYNEYNVNLGYVQGMSDLLSPLYVVFQDDAIAFWAFCGFMKRMERNFLRDQSGMRQQLLSLDHLVQLMLPKLYVHFEKADSTHFFFFFRMLLVWYKREFEWDDVLRLWEVLWTDYLSSQFHLFVALAILDKNKDEIMEHYTQFDEILKYMNELSMKIDLEDTLVRAEILFTRFKKTVDMVDRKRAEQNNEDAAGQQEGLPKISDELRLLLSKEVIETKEVERPPNAGGG